MYVQIWLRFLHICAVEFFEGKIRTSLYVFAILILDDTVLFGITVLTNDRFNSTEQCAKLSGIISIPSCAVTSCKRNRFRVHAHQSTRDNVLRHIGKRGNFATANFHLERFCDTHRVGVSLHGLAQKIRTTSIPFFCWKLKISSYRLCDNPTFQPFVVPFALL